MPRYWLISDRNNGGTGSGRNVGRVNYFVSDSPALTDIKNWQKAGHDDFRNQLIKAADAFPELSQADNQDQSHVTILIHGFNVGFQSSVSFYQHVCAKLFEGPHSLGLCILYDWPSLGSIAGYEPDRASARACADDLTNLLSELYDWLLRKQKDALSAAKADALGTKPTVARPCKAKVSVIAHSMGNYLLQKAMADAWTRKNQPLLASLINQLVMVAADVDNDIFDDGAPDNGDGNAIDNLTYRITALYSGRDAVLGSSAGLKHFGTRRLGRSGLAHWPPLSSTLPETDNVWDIDCSSFFPEAGFNLPGIGGIGIHGAYFVTDGTIALMRQILRGVDHGVLVSTGVTKGTAWPPK